MCDRPTTIYYYIRFHIRTTSYHGEVPTVVLLYYYYYLYRTLGTRACSRERERKMWSIGARGQTDRACASVYLLQFEAFCWFRPRRAAVSFSTLASSESFLFQPPLPLPHFIIIGSIIRNLRQRRSFFFYTFSELFRTDENTRWGDGGRLVSLPAVGTW